MTGFEKFMYIVLAFGIAMNEIVTSLDAGINISRAFGDGAIYGGIFTVIYIVINKPAEDE